MSVCSCNYPPSPTTSEALTKASSVVSLILDGSLLHLREFVDVEIEIDRLMYVVYQYMDAAKSLIFRYDNTGHHKELGLPTYPHHKHEGSEDNVVSSSAPDLASILGEIEALVQLL
jgi:hypothetical protein